MTKFKCDDCKNHIYDGGSNNPDAENFGPSEHWCAKEHWGGGPVLLGGGPDPWIDCKDYDGETDTDIKRTEEK